MNKLSAINIVWKRATCHSIRGIRAKIREFIHYVFILDRRDNGIGLPVFRSAMLVVGLAVFLLSPKPANAQHHAYEQYTVDDGLPSNYVYRLAEDELGYLWAATENGLARFDGYEWKSYGLDDGLTGLDVYEMTVLPSGELIVGGLGFLPMVISHGEVRPFGALLDSVYSYQYIVINSYPCLVSRVSPKTKQRSYFEILSSDMVTNMNIEGSGNYSWIYTHFFGNEIDFNELVDIARVTFYSSPFYVDKFASGSDGIAIFDGQLIRDGEELISRIESIDLNEVLEKEYGSVTDNEIQTWSNSTLSIFDSTLSATKVSFQSLSEDVDVNVGMRSRSGDFWVATRSAGVIRIPRLAQKVNLLEDTEGISWEGVLQATFGTFVADDYSNLYQYEFGKLRPHQQLHASYRQSRFRALSLMPNNDELIFSRDNRVFLIDSVGVKPLGAQYGQYDLGTGFFTTQDSVIYDKVGLGSSRSFQANKNTFTYGNNLIWYTTDSAVYHVGESQPYYVALFPSNAARGTNHYVDQHRLYELDFNKEELSIRWRTDSLTILTAIERSDDSFLLGTERSGVFSLDLSIEPPLLRHLIDCGPVKKLKFLDGDIWAATYTGVYRFSLSGDVKLHLKKGKGLLTDETYDMDLAGDSVLIATANGLAIIEKELVDSPPQIIPDLHVRWRDIWVDGILRSPRNNRLELSPGEDNLELSFALLHPALGDDIDYEVQLTPIDATPRIQRQRSVRYASLSPGEYQLSIRAVLADGSSYSLERPLQLVLASPLYKQPWFIIFCSLVLAAGVFTYVRQRERSKAKLRETQQQALRKSSELQLEALRSQMNPHFIFNALGSIQYFIQKEDKDNADEYLGRFAMLMRRYLDGSKRNTTSISDEISMLRQYLELEMMRAKSSFSYDLRVDPQLSDHQQIPSMLLQPLVENAILHGLLVRKDGNAHLTVAIEQSGDMLIATVADNGQGFANAQRNKRQGHRSRASLIMQERIEALRLAGIADVDIRYQDNAATLSSNDTRSTQFPGARVTIHIRNMHNDV